jgi:hypothetical protein
MQSTKLERGAPTSCALSLQGFGQAVQMLPCYAKMKQSKSGARKQP